MYKLTPLVLSLINPDVGYRVEWDERNYYKEQNKDFQKASGIDNQPFGVRSTVPFAG